MLFIYGQASSDLEALRQYADRSHQQNALSKLTFDILGSENIYEAKFFSESMKPRELFLRPCHSVKRTRTWNLESEGLKSNCSSLTCLTLTKVLNVSEVPCLPSNTGITNTALSTDLL